MDYNNIDGLPRDKLLELCRIYAKNWLATDGLWFQSIEAKYGIDEALEHDANAMRKFTEIEAKRIKEFLALEDNPGLDGLKKALSFRLYATLNVQEFVEEDNALIYKMVSCRVQNARKKKGMAYHPCKPIGLIEYTYFAKVIDSRIKTEAISCHPDITDESCNCIWKFTLAE